MAGDIRTATAVVDKAPGEVLTRTMGFGSGTVTWTIPNITLASGESIASIVSTIVNLTGGSDLVVDSSSFSGTTVTLTVSGGVANTLYEITVTVTTDAVPVQTIVGVGRVRVQEE